MFNAQSVGPRGKRTEIVEFIPDEDVDVMFLTETWRKTQGDEAKCADRSPPGYTFRSFPPVVLVVGIFCPYAYSLFGDPLVLCHLCRRGFFSCVLRCVFVSLFPERSRVQGPGFSSMSPQHLRYPATNTNSSTSGLFLGLTT